MRSRASQAFGQRLTVLEYLEQNGWKVLRSQQGRELAGLCPLHRETRPSFFVNPSKDVFYCHGCGRGGDVIRLIQLREGATFPQALARAQRQPRAATPLEQAVHFYRQHWCSSERARSYVRQRGIHSHELLERMRVGYAPGGCLRAHLEQVGFTGADIADSRLLTARGRDRLYRCVIFPLDNNLYGRSLEDFSLRHQFLPGPKGGLYGWEPARPFPSLIVVEGVFDVAALWQAGIPNAVAALGAHLNRAQMQQLCSEPQRRVYVCLDGDAAGQAAARRWTAALQAAHVPASRVTLPEGQDPNSLFVAGASASDFLGLLRGAMS